MAYLSKNDEKNFFNLLPSSEMVLENIVENLLCVKRQKHEVDEKLMQERNNLLRTFGEYPSIIEKIPVNITFLKNVGFCYDINIFLVKVFSLYAHGTALRKKMDYKRLQKIGESYYAGDFENYSLQMKELFKELKVNISNVINGNVITFDMTQNDIEQHIKNRKTVNWFIRNMDELINTYTKSIPDDIMEYFDQDKILLLLSHLALSKIADNYTHEEEICKESIQFIKTYVAYILYRRKENPNYNPSYHYVEFATNNTSLISADTVIIQAKEFNSAMEEFNDEICIKEEELLNLLPDLKRNIKIQEFRKDIELSWEFLPEKQYEATGKKMPIFKYSKTEEEQKELEDRKEQLLEEKIELFSSLPYISSLKGMNRFEGYVAYLFENGRVILEKFYKKTKHGAIPTYNEAIYVMNITDFKELSKMGKTEIREYAKEAGLDVKVINHTKNFKTRVLNEVNSISYNENVLDFIEDLVTSAKRPEELRK